jgi:hypothetical protein
VKEAISDLQFKIAADRFKNEPITMDTVIDVSRYRAITGACLFGVNQWREQNGITSDTITVKELLPLLEKTNAYGLKKFKSLIVKQ